jgi:hypothetical protein
MGHFDVFFRPCTKSEQIYKTHVYKAGGTISRFSVAGSNPARLEFTRFDPFSAAFDDVTNQWRGPRSAWAGRWAQE